MMQYKGYIGRVEFDPDAKTLHGKVIGIRDVVTFQGDSVKEVQKAFRESVDDYLEFCAQRGESPDKPFSGQFVLRVDAGLHRKLNMLAQAEGKSLNAFVAERLNREVQTELSRGAVKSTSTSGPNHRKKKPSPRSKRRAA